MAWKTLFMAASMLAMCFTSASSLAEIIRTPYQIVHRSSGKCLESGYQSPEAHLHVIPRDVLKLADCQEVKNIQKFYLMNAKTQEEIIPQTFTNAAGESTFPIAIMSAVAWDFKVGTKKYMQVSGCCSELYLYESGNLAPTNDEGTTFVFYRAQPSNRYSNANFRIANRYEFNEIRPLPCDGTSVHAVAERTCATPMNLWRLQPTTYPVKP